MGKDAAQWNKEDSMSWDSKEENHRQKPQDIIWDKEEFNTEKINVRDTYIVLQEF